MIKWCNCDVDADCFCRGGNPRAIVNVKMDPRLRGDDDIGAVVPTLSHFVTPAKAGRILAVRLGETIRRVGANRHCRESAPIVTPAKVRQSSFPRKYPDRHSREGGNPCCGRQGQNGLPPSWG